jgi:hypothetical protein
VERVVRVGDASAGLPARHAAHSDTKASTLIHAIVMVCTPRIRRKVSGVPICGTEAIHDIMASWLWLRPATKRVDSERWRLPRETHVLEESLDSGNRGSAFDQARNRSRAARTGLRFLPQCVEVASSDESASARHKRESIVRYI